MEGSGHRGKADLCAPAVNGVNAALRIARDHKSPGELGLRVANDQKSGIPAIGIGRRMNNLIVCEIRSRLAESVIETIRYIDVKLSQNLHGRAITTGSDKRVAVNFDQSRQHMRLFVEVGKSHQVKAVLSRPVERILAARASYPDRRMRALNRLRQDAESLVFE